MRRYEFCLMFSFDQDPLEFTKKFLLITGELWLIMQNIMIEKLLGHMNELVIFQVNSHWLTLNLPNLICILYHKKRNEQLLFYECKN